MYGKSFARRDRGVTPVIGVILMISITVLLAATTAAFVMGIDNKTVQTKAPTVVVEWDYDADASGTDGLEITHDTGGALRTAQTEVIVEGAACSGSGSADGRYDATAFGVSGDMTAGTSIVLDNTSPTLCGGDLDLRAATVKLVWTAPDGARSDVLATWTGPGS
jgi:flagellin-like protein